ncbi:tetratricopeptide repeat protein [Acrocarpospora catenulata]|uniref:tetratricopeptide repeat protein n=1 Tax=Acrocarpospora catenulata TaxID=2836182 RepID=UPI001BD916E8|nr:tetratricopeptide repeat protein [Acrocarpospora catenulata]
MVAEILLGWVIEEVLERAVGVTGKSFTDSERQAVLKKTVKLVRAHLPKGAEGDQLADTIRRLLSGPRSAWYEAGVGETDSFAQALKAALTPLLAARSQRGAHQGETGEEFLARHDLDLDRLVQLVESAAEQTVHEVAVDRGGLPETLRQADARALQAGIADVQATLAGMPQISTPSPELPHPADVQPPPGMNNLPRTPARIFVGRDQALARLGAALADEENVVVTQTVYGLGGVGKSELALHHAHNCRDRYQLRWWITANDEEQIEAGLAALTGRLLPTTILLAETGQQAAQWALNWLQAHTQWLLVLDNVEDPHHVQPLLGQLSSGHVLITTRRDIGWHRLATPIPLDVLDPGSATKLIMKVAGHTSDSDEILARQLAEELGFLPLALEQAAAYIAQTRISLDRYLALLADHPARMHAATADGGQAERTIARLWQITLTTINQRNPLAVQLLYILAQYAPDQIPRSILPHTADVIDIDEALGLLSSYSMVTLTQDTISMHRLMQAVLLTGTHEDQPDPDTARDTALGWLAATLPDDPQYDPSGWPRWRQLTPHIDALTSRYRQSSEPALLGRVLNSSAIFHRVQGSHGRAVDIALRALAIAESEYGSDHPDVAVGLGNLAVNLGDLGKSGEAVLLEQRALAITEAAYGPDHPAVAVRLSNLAASFSDLGRPREAVPLFERALAITEAAYGPDHPDVATLLGNLAGSLRDLGRSGEAVPLEQRALAIAESVYGPDHPDVAVRLGNLAASLGDLGRSGEAVPLEQRALAITEAAYGPDHPDVAIWLGNLAASLRDLGRSGEAVLLEQRALAITEAAYGPDHPTVAVKLGNLAASLRDLGRSGEAVLLEQRALAITESVYGPDHPDVAVRLGNLAASLRDLGRSGEAVPLFERALAITEAAYGPDHPTVAIRLGNLAVILRDLGRWGEAVPLEQRALAITEAAYGPDHPAVAVGLGNLALSLYDLGRSAEAVPLLGRALAIAEAAYGPDHPDVAVGLGNLAASLCDLGRSGEAVPLFERALAITQAAYGPDHPTVAVRLSNLAASFSDLGRSGEAVPLFERALAITQAAYGPDHPTVAVRLSNLAASFSDLGRSGEAVPLFERALAITQAAYGPDHPTMKGLQEARSLALNSACPCGSGRKLKRCHRKGPA